jgi:hypothetical protein
MTKEEIKEINDRCPDEQGIFIEPSMIPVHIKEPVIYRRFKTSAMEGGNCWGDKPVYVKYDEKNENWVALDLVLEKLNPNITYLQYKKINNLIHDNSECYYEYYGNSTDYKVQYIILSELEDFLNTF